MNFAEELRRAAQYDPLSVLEQEDPPRNPLFLRPRLRVTQTQVLDVAEGLPKLVAVGAAKGLYGRETWARMALAGGSREEQWVNYIRRRDPKLVHTAIWVSGEFMRVLTRETPRVVFSTITMGKTPTPEQRLDLYRALWDVGTERFYGYIRKDHPILQDALTRPGNREESCPIDPDSVCCVYPVDARGPRP